MFGLAGLGQRLDHRDKSDPRRYGSVIERVAASAWATSSAALLVLASLIQRLSPPDQAMPLGGG